MRVKLEKDGSLVITAETIAEGWALQATHPTGADPRKIILDMTVLGGPSDYVSPTPKNDVIGYPITDLADPTK